MHDDKKKLCLLTVLKLNSDSSCLSKMSSSTEFKTEMEKKIIKQTNKTTTNKTEIEES